MAMTIRFSPLAADLVREEAAREGVAVSQFTREAAIACAAHRRGKRDDPVWPQTQEKPHPEG